MLSEVKQSTPADRSEASFRQEGFFAVLKMTSRNRLGTA